MRKAGASNYANYSKKILNSTIKPVSCEVFSDDMKNMIKQGEIINKWNKKSICKNSCYELKRKIYR